MPTVLLQLLGAVGVGEGLHDGVQGVGEAAVQVAVLVRVVAAVDGGAVPAQGDLSSAGHVPGRVGQRVDSRVGGVEHAVLHGYGAVGAHADQDLVGEALVGDAGLAQPVAPDDEDDEDSDGGQDDDGDGDSDGDGEGFVRAFVRLRESRG